MIFQFEAVVRRPVEEELSITVDADDEVEAEEKVVELISTMGYNSDVIARRFMVDRRYWGEPEDIDVKQIVADPEEPEYA